jgi:hypothetical protein
MNMIKSMRLLLRFVNKSFKIAHCFKCISSFYSRITKTVLPAGTSLTTPDPAPIIAPLPKVVWSFIEALPPIITPSPKVTDPAKPLSRHNAKRPNLLLWPIWTKLSILQPSPRTVELNFPLSTQELAPISTPLPMITLPICGILTNPLSGQGLNPKPSAPIVALGWMIQSFPIWQRSLTTLPDHITVLVPTVDASRIVTFG